LTAPAGEMFDRFCFASTNLHTSHIAAPHT
jgi:hypothetical protein